MPNSTVLFQIQVGTAWPDVKEQKMNHSLACRLRGDMIDRQIMCFRDGGILKGQTSYL